MDPGEADLVNPVRVPVMGTTEIIIASHGGVADKMKDKTTIKIKVITEIKDETIFQRVILLGTEPSKSVELIRQACDTTEKELRDALIALGWTPPEDKSMVNSYVRRL
jgi:hypothetical protein